MHAMAVGFSNGSLVIVALPNTDSKEDTSCTDQQVSRSQNCSDANAVLKDSRETSTNTKTRHTSGRSASKGSKER